MNMNASSQTEAAVRGKEQNRSREPAPGSDAFALLGFQPRKANVLWTRQEWTNLALHLHNENDATVFIMGFRADGEIRYVRSKKKRVDQAISWAWSSMNENARSKIAFVPYSTNSRKQSRWGALDFDAHHPGQANRAREFAFAAFRCLLNRPDLFVILEGSGRGYHVWAIAKEFRPVPDWIRLLKRVAEAIGAPISAGICEIFPPDTLQSSYGKGMRAPGCWNPTTDTCSEIFWASGDDLTSLLSGKSSEPSLETGDLQPHFPDTKKKTSFSSPSFSQTDLYKAPEWLERFSIVASATRNDRLTGLVGEVFHQVGRAMARALAETQFATKTVETNATVDEHLASFEALWSGLNERWLASLNSKERSAYLSLDTDNQRDAFRILRSFASYAQQKGQTDFPLVRENLGKRLGITPNGAAGIREKFIRLGIMAKTLAYKPNKEATRCKWLLHVEGTA
jgi:hypothetical protein